MVSALNMRTAISNNYSKFADCVAVFSKDGKRIVTPNSSELYARLIECVSPIKQPLINKTQLSNPFFNCKNSDKKIGNLLSNIGKLRELLETKKPGELAFILRTDVLRRLEAFKKYGTRCSAYKEYYDRMLRRDLQEACFGKNSFTINLGDEILKNNAKKLNVL